METIVFLLKVLFSEDLALRLVPVCFVVDNLILFYYFYRIQSYKTEEEAKKGKALYWKLLAWQAAYFIFLLCNILFVGIESIYGPMLFFAVMYYVITLVVVVIFLAYLIKISFFKLKVSK